jgi:hypothetical protein
MSLADTYGSLSSYFNQTGAVKSQGKGGGSGGSAQQYTGGGDATSINPSATASGGGYALGLGISASDKSAFSTPFSQQFGGITNNQVIDSPYATGATNTSPIAPISSPTNPTQASLGNPVVLIAVIFAGVALVLFARR